MKNYVFLQIIIILAKLLPLVKEANLCGKEFKRNVNLELKMARELPDWMEKKYLKI